ncbi:hypothetical protein BC936DRAFT_144293 [Jimgerdemannia flammicorona]|uniref:DNA2/NAM7 helicase-like C-terminal domain-containing protein n=1 Tax=Jimgerdemannia flammicorona TaxID=994334 RepID=A0A433DCT5_9FUNG|nr:hypothetical protein BC936DRAFT_144293 [Jimgerdemannia flammicorona]
MKANSKTQRIPSVMNTVNFDTPTTFVYHCRFSSARMAEKNATTSTASQSTWRLILSARANALVGARPVARWEGLALELSHHTQCKLALPESKLKDLSAKYSSDISVKSLEGFQGQERHVIIFSATRSNSAGSSPTTAVLTLPLSKIFALGHRQLFRAQHRSCVGQFYQQLPDTCRISERPGSASILQYRQGYTVVFPAKELKKTPKQGTSTAFNTNIWQLHFTRRVKDNRGAYDRHKYFLYSRPRSSKKAPTGWLRRELEC